MAIFVSENFLPVAFDSGGVTTGPITVPFIMALGIGVASISNKNNMEDSFGLVALCSIGPILSVFMMGMFTDTSEIVYEPTLYSPINDNVFLHFIKEMPQYMKEVAIAIAPILVFFIIYQLVALKLPLKTRLKIIIGILYTYIGFVLFLTGANTGFLPAGNLIGAEIGASSYSWILIPIGIIVGFFIVAAEPAVHVLNAQVEEISGGTIKKRSMLISLMCGTAVSLALSMIRVLTGISIWWFILPGYAIALILSFFVPKVFTSIAFDSGGVASGPMTATFLLPFAIGACSSLGGNIMTDAFGIVAMVAMTPLVTIQILGMVSVFKLKKLQKAAESIPPSLSDEIIVTQKEEVCNVKDISENDTVIDLGSSENPETEILDLENSEDNEKKKGINEKENEQNIENERYNK